MVQWLGCWIPNPTVLVSYPPCGSKIHPDFHPSEVGQMNTRNSWGLSGKSKLSPRSGSVALRQLNYIHKSGTEIIF